MHTVNQILNDITYVVAVFLLTKLMIGLFSLGMFYIVRNKWAIEIT